MILSDTLLSEVYDELHRIASAILRGERAHHTLQPSALINEAYLRMARHRVAAAGDRHHFLRLAARAMRQVLIDYSRGHRAQKRGRCLVEPGGDTGAESAAESIDLSDYVTIHTALEQLERLDPHLAAVVELRFFGGLSIEETAAALGTSQTSVKREWTVARDWLRAALEARPPA